MKWRWMRHLLGTIIALALLVPARSASGATRLPITKDNSIVLVPGEWHLNAGAQQLIRIKGNQHLVAMAFDTTAIRGKRVRSATLVCQKGAGEISGVTISTIQAPWDEYRSNSLTSGVDREAGWGYPHAMFPAVTGGNAFSLVCRSDSRVEGATYRWDVTPDLVHACAVGASYGITLHEFEADYSRNPTIFSRESRGREPFLMVELGGEEPPPDPPQELKLTHAGDGSDLRLSLLAPQNAFAYDVQVNGAPLGRWNAPFAKPGETQVIPIRDIPLRDGQTVSVAVTSLNRMGERSQPANATIVLPRREKLAEPAVSMLRSAGAASADLAVIPLLDKYDRRGKAVGLVPADYLSCNDVFDGSTVQLAAARGEVVGFQVLLRGRGKVTLECDLPGLRADMFRAFYVPGEGGREIPDPLVPFRELELMPDEATPVCVDVYVPFDFRPRQVDGWFKISDGRKLPVRLTIRDFAIPRAASFLCEMNSYGLTNTVAEFYRLQQVAYDHRVHVNLLHYSHGTAAPGSRKCNMDMLMPSGRRMNERAYNDIRPGAKTTYWDDFIAAFGPYLSGSCFKDGHRGAVSAPGFYLTFHESWPLNVRGYFNGNPDAYEAFKKTPVYKETFVNLLSDFVRVAKQEGWTETGFQVYLNNKGSLNDPRLNPWVLDEPVAFWDYRALSFYGGLVEQAKGPKCPVRFDYRIDISRPEFDRGELAGKSDLWVVSLDAFQTYPRLVRDRKEREGLRFWVYGSSNRVEDSNRTIEAWALQAYRGGASGIVPWQTIDRDGSALKQADQLGIFIFGDTPMNDRPVYHSLRLKAYRRAQQDIEYLQLLRNRLNLSDAQMAEFVDRYVDLSGRVGKRYPEDSGTPEYGDVAPEGFRRLREAAAVLIENAGRQPPTRSDE